MITMLESAIGETKQKRDDLESWDLMKKGDSVGEKWIWQRLDIGGDRVPDVGWMGMFVYWVGLYEISRCLHREERYQV